MIWIAVIASALAVVAGAFVYGVRRIRNNAEQAHLASRGLAEPEFIGLAEDALTGFSDRLGITIDLNDPDDAAKAISVVFDRHQHDLKTIYAREGFFWYFVLPCGALLGEYMRLHAGGEWVQEDDDEWAIHIPVAGESDPAITFPFMKVLKQLTMGDEGDIYAYLMSSRELDRMRTAVGE